MEAALKKAWQLTKLTCASIIPDLLCFTMWEAIGLAIFAASSIVFSFIDFNYLTDPANNPSIYSTVNDRLAGTERNIAMLFCIFEVLSLFLFRPRKVAADINVLQRRSRVYRSAMRSSHNERQTLCFLLGSHQFIALWALRLCIWYHHYLYDNRSCEI